VCCVLFERGVLFCVMCVICVLRLIVVPLPPSKNPFEVKISNNNNNNNNNNVVKEFLSMDQVFIFSFCKMFLDILW
jgi:hypothetical protein